MAAEPLLLGEPPTVLFDLADAVLAECAARLGAVGRRPERVCVYPGDIPDEIGFDITNLDVLAVSVGSLGLSRAFPADAGDTPVDCATGRGAVDLAVVLIRCVPSIEATGLPPKAEALSEAARLFYTDVWRVWAGAVCAMRAFPVDASDGDGPRATAARGCAITGPAGGAVRATARFTVEVSA